MSVLLYKRKMEVFKLKTLLLMFKVISDISAQTANFTLSQAHLCSYVSLCTLSNTSIYESKSRYLEPCCRNCSCEKHCEEFGTCCPDYNGKKDMEMSTQSLLDSVSNGSEHFNNTNDRLGCVRTHYGLLYSKEGFVMRDSCPETFSEYTTKVRCEAKWDYRNADIYDHLPISDKVTGQTYKNRFCLSCHSPMNGSYQFWEFRFVCTGMPKFRFFYLTSPFELVEKTFRSKARTCSIVFRPKNISTASVSTETCEREEIIDTCEDGDSGVITACHEYTWPLMVQTPLKLETYKNYACMLCNGVEFRESCYSHSTLGYRTQPYFAVILNVETPELKPNETWQHYRNKNLTQDVIIRQNFTKANAYCSEGFIYDVRKRLCRQVLCPVYFFVKNGKCEPVFAVIENGFYKIILEILLPYSIKGAPVSVVDTALFSSLDDILQKRLNMQFYDLSLWRNNISAKEIKKDIKYVVFLSVSFHFGKGNYHFLLEFVNHLVLIERQLPISILMKNAMVNVNVGLTFGTYVALYNQGLRYRLTYLQSVDPLKIEVLHPVRPFGWKQFISKPNVAMDVKKTSFCHTVVMTEEEIRLLTPDGSFIEELATKRILNNHRSVEGTIVCIDDAFSGVDERASYVMNSTASLSYLYEWQPKPKTKMRPRFIDSTSDISSNKVHVSHTADTKSIAAVIISCVLVLVLFFIRRCLKRYANRSQTNDDAEADINVDGFVENIEMSDIRQRSESID